ncbi:MAG: DUF1761 domain-containing protein [Candidatus Saccharimonadales bacterium]
MTINYLAVAVATVAEFIIGAIWYMPIFGSLWRKIHGFDDLSKADKQAAQKQMMPLLVIQLIITAATTVVLAKLMLMLPDYSAYKLAAMAWVGFVVPTQIAAIIFGGTPPKWMVTKALIMASGSFACLMTAVAILSAF